MDTNWNSEPPRKWESLARQAAAQPPPVIDVRLAIRQQIEAEMAAARTPVEKGDFATDLVALFRTTWMRAAMGGLCAACLLVGILGWRAAESLSEPLLYAVSGDPANESSRIP